MNNIDIKKARFITWRDAARFAIKNRIKHWYVIKIDKLYEVRQYEED